MEVGHYLYAGKNIRVPMPCSINSTSVIWHYDTDEFGVDSYFKRNGSMLILLKIKNGFGAVYAIPIN